MTLHDEIACAAIHHWLGLVIRKSNIPGAQLCVVRKGEVLFDQAYGVASELTQQPLNTKHLMAFSSHSKMITSAATWRLIERGNLSLTDKVATYLDGFKNNPDSRFQDITVRDLLTHRAGLEREGPYGAFWEGEITAPTRAEVEASAAHAKLIYAPNTVTKYSNYGYALLGAVIERAANMSYERYSKLSAMPAVLEKELYPDVVLAPEERLSTGHSRAEASEKRVPLIHVPSGGLSPACGFYATARSMALLTYELLCGSRLLSPTTQKELLGTFWPVHRDTSVEYGYGLDKRTFDKRVMIGHNGAHFGHQTLTSYIQEQDIVVSVALNARQLASPLVRSIAEIFDCVTKTFDQREVQNVVVTDPLFGVEDTKLFIVGADKAIEVLADQMFVNDNVQVLKKGQHGFVDTTRKGTDFDGEPVLLQTNETGKIISADVGGQILVPERLLRQRMNRLRVNPCRVSQ